MAMTRAEIQKNYRERLKSRGLTKSEVWVNSDKIQKVKQYVSFLNFEISEDDLEIVLENGTIYHITHLPSSTHVFDSNKNEAMKKLKLLVFKQLTNTK